MFSRFTAQSKNLKPAMFDLEGGNEGEKKSLIKGVKSGFFTKA
jgi:hypothetical protein